MTEMSNLPPIPEIDNIPTESASPWVMLISMLLLISVLILSSAMLVHYAMDGKEGPAKKSVFDFAKLMEAGKEFSTKTQSIEKQNGEGNASVAPTDSAIKTFFSGRENRAVRWPKLKLTGFGIPSNSKIGFAIINGKHLIVGGTVNGVTLVEILDHGVRVEYKGETKTLIVEITR